MGPHQLRAVSTHPMPFTEPWGIRVGVQLHHCCFSCRCRQYSSLRLPLMYSHPYSQITVETEFDNPIYETGVSGPTALLEDFPLPSLIPE